MSLARNYFQSCSQTVHQSAAWSVCDRGQEWSHTMDIPWKSLCHKGHLRISAKWITTLGSLQCEKLWILQLAVREWDISMVCMHQMINQTWTACRKFICGVILLSYSNTVGHTLQCHDLYAVVLGRENTRCTSDDSGLCWWWLLQICSQSLPTEKSSKISIQILTLMPSWRWAA